MSELVFSGVECLETAVVVVSDLARWLDWAARRVVVSDLATQQLVAARWLGCPAPQEIGPA
jgi:hypothetical protein